MYSDFVFLDRFLFELSCKNTHTHKHTHRDSNEYPIVAFSKNATIKNATKKGFQKKTIVAFTRYIIGVFCYNFKLQTNILAS